MGFLLLSRWVIYGFDIQLPHDKNNGFSNINSMLLRVAIKVIFLIFFLFWETINFLIVSKYFQPNTFFEYSLCNVTSLKYMQLSFTWTKKTRRAISLIYYPLHLVEFNLALKCCFSLKLLNSECCFQQYRSLIGGYILALSLYIYICTCWKFMIY